MNDDELLSCDLDGWVALWRADLDLYITSRLRWCVLMGGDVYRSAASHAQGDWDDKKGVCDDLPTIPPTFVQPSNISIFYLRN